VTAHRPNSIGGVTQCRDPKPLETLARFHRRKREDHLREHLIMQLSAAHAFELPLRKQWVHGGAR